MATPVSLHAPWATETDTTLEHRKNARRQHRQAHSPPLHAAPAKGESFFSVGGLGRAIPPPLHAPPPDSQLQRHQEWQHSIADAVAAVQDTARTKARGGARAIIFDFDKTLAATDVGTHLLSGGSAQIVDRVFGGAARFAMLKDLLEKLSNVGCVLAVLSLNSRHIVQRALGQAGLVEMFTLVLGDEDFEMDPFRQKGRLIRDKMMPKLGVSSGADLLFADDDPRQVNNVRDTIPGCTCIWVQAPPPPRFGSFRPHICGVDEEYSRAILAWARETSELV